MQKIAQQLFFAFFFASAAQAELPENMKNVEAPIVILGASYAANWPIAQLAGHPVVNRGIGGNQSFEMHERFARDVTAQAPAKVLIWGFINDIFRADYEQMPVAKERIRNDYKAMIDTAEREGIEVVLATEVLIRPQAGLTNWAIGLIGNILGKTSYQEMINEHVRDVNRWMRRYARDRGIVVLDFEVLLANSDGMRKSQFAVEDGSHLTKAAYDTMTQYTKDALRAD